MRLIRLTVENFRCYRSAFSVTFGDITAFIGQNDAGKSTLMEALAIFFEVAAPDKDDASKDGDPTNMCITCEFDQLPGSLVVDTDYPTTLADEYLESDNGTLIIKKMFNGGLATPKVSLLISAEK